MSPSVCMSQHLYNTHLTIARKWTFFNTFPSHSLLYMFHHFIDILRTYSAISTNVSHIYVCMNVSYEYKNIQTHTCIYIYYIVVIKLYCKRGREFYWYSTFKCDYWIAIIRYVYLFYFFKSRPHFSYFPLLQTQCLISCVCVCLFLLEK